MKRLAIALVSALALAACQDPSSSSPAAAEQPAAGTGAAAFRLGSAELSALSVSSDSLRVEAWRDGRIISASGSLAKGVQIDGLSPGTWTFKVAAYDMSGAMRWYGEASTLVIAGRTVDLTVTLRAATGSVRVGIVLDSGDVDTTRYGPVKDTLWPAVDTVFRSSYTGMPFVGAAFSGPYVAIRVAYNCNATRLVLVRTVDDTGVVHLRVANAGPLTEMACITLYTEQILMYKPRSARELIKVEDHLGNSVFLVAPTTPTTTVRGKFATFEFSQGAGFPVRVTQGVVNSGSFQLLLDSTGHYTAFRGRNSCDSATGCTHFVDTASGVLAAAALDSARRLFADTAVYNSVSVVASHLMCADAPWWKAAVGYSDGHVATFSKPEEICSGLPLPYERVSAFAWSLLSMAFPR